MPNTDDNTYIIQHPNGVPKQLGLHNNIVQYIDKEGLQNWKDAEGGSPVFNSILEVVAIHQG